MWSLESCMPGEIPKPGRIELDGISTYYLVGYEGGGKCNHRGMGSGPPEERRAGAQIFTFSIFRDKTLSFDTTTSSLIGEGLPRKGDMLVHLPYKSEPQDLADPPL